MSEIRRKLMMLVNSAGSTWTEIARVTTTGTTTVNIPKTYSQLGFFVVGGGGSGHGDYNTSAASGCGGNGGCVNSFIVPFGGTSCSVTVGDGGKKGYSQSNSNNGSKSSVSYNGKTYTSDGGHGGCNTVWEKNTPQNNSGVGGFQIYTRDLSYTADELYVLIDYCNTHNSTEITDLEVSPNHIVHARGAKGQDGLSNPFDKSDINLYGAGGGGGYNTYNMPISSIPNPAPGGTNGGGTGGYGADNASTNKGLNATFYGGGGGGGAFSSGHTYGQGGAGYQGIVIIYGK